jgi:apolipoprotein N-acyltransferase
MQMLQAHFAKGERAALIGIPLGNMKEGYTNSAIGLKPGADVYRYDKHHLVPFGEFIPPLFRWFTDLMNIPLGDFNRGPLGQPPFEWQGQRLAPNICYEDLFGEELGVQFADAARAPTILVNISNIAWFGNSVAIDQHLQISRMRAIEFQRPMIRATNTGATAIIDHRGRVAQLLPRLTRGVLTGEVEGQTAITGYAWWVSRLGLWPLWLLALAVVALAIWRQRSAPAGSGGVTPAAE